MPEDMLWERVNQQDSVWKKCRTDPKYAACKPDDRALVIPRVFWKCLLRVSNRPYAKPCYGHETLQIRDISRDCTQRKNNIVTSDSGSRDCLTLSSDAFVTESSRTRKVDRCRCQNDLFGAGVSRIWSAIPNSTDSHRRR